MPTSTISVRDLKKKMDRGEDFTLIDARQRLSFEREHIMGSISLPLADMPRKAKQILALDKEIIVYCGGPTCEVSQNAVEKLVEMGFKKVVRFKGGLQEWKVAGLPTESEA